MAEGGEKVCAYKGLTICPVAEKNIARVKDMFEACKTQDSVRTCVREGLETLELKSCPGCVIRYFR
jgi:hypothetical protein